MKRFSTMWFTLNIGHQIKKRTIQIQLSLMHADGTRILQP